MEQGGENLAASRLIPLKLAPYQTHDPFAMDSIIQILVEDILVFAYCSADQIDEDFSVEQLERIASKVSAAGDSDVKRFCAVVRAMADEARASGQLQRAEQLDAMPQHLGLDG
jgi:hypothetical protein